MRKIVAGLFISLDGVIEMPEQGRAILPYFNDDVVKPIQSDQEEADTILLGRRTYEELARRKRQPGKSIAIAGSGTLVRSLLSEGLIDQLRLLVFPIVFGSGKHLFDGWADQMPMRLVESRTLSNGVLSLSYEPAKRIAGETEVAS